MPGTIVQFAPRRLQTSPAPNCATVLDGGAERRFYRYGKRFIDIAVSLLLLLLLAPLLVVIAILIKLDSPGPVFFVQQRVGCRPAYANGRTRYVIRNFQFYKFRSMRADVDHGLHQVCVRNYVNGCRDGFARNGTFKLCNDPRVTRVGRLLRKTSTDELPQLLNVLKGEMSLVGPRPVPPYEIAHYLPPHFARLAALPGITGAWQVSGRGAIPFEEMIRLDLQYVCNASLWLDLKIMLLTIPAVFSGWGAQ